MRKITMAILSVLTVLVTLAACNGGAPPTADTTTDTPATNQTTPTTTPTQVSTPSTPSPVAETPQYGGTLTFVESVDITRSFDPIRMGYSSQRMLGGMVYEQLGIGDWSRGPGGTNEFAFNGYYFPVSSYTGDLAESWELSTDGLTTIVHLRQGVHFHNKPPANGREVTANDVKYCWDRRLGTGSGFTQMTPYLVEGMTDVEGITVIDKYTVSFKAKRFNFVMLPLILTGYYSFIYPQEAVAEFGNLEDWRNAIGTGAFIISDYVANSSLTLKKNPNYYREDELFPQNQLPYVDEIKRLVITDASTRVAAIRSYKADLITFGVIDFRQKADFEATMPGLQFGPTGSGRSAAVIMKLDVAPFDDIRVRKALQMGTNVEDLKQILGGTRPGYSSWLNHDFGSLLYVPLEDMPQDIQELYVYDPTRAKQLLAEAGYPNGFKTELWVSNTADLSEWEILQSQWKLINVDLNLVLKEGALISTALSQGSFPSMITGEMGAVSYTTSLRWGAQRSVDVYGWSGPVAEAAKAKWTTITSTVDEAERNRLMKELNLTLLQNVAAIPLAVDAYTYQVAQSWVKGWHGELQLRQHEPGTVLTRLWIDTAKKKAVTGK